MGELEKRINKYLYKWLVTRGNIYNVKSDFKKEAHDLAEITDKENKKQIADIKYLDRRKIEKAFKDHYDDYENIYYVDEIITQILQLIPEEGVVIAEGEVNITKEKHTGNEIFGISSEDGIFISQKFESFNGKKGRLVFIEDKEG